MISGGVYEDGLRRGVVEGSRLDPGAFGDAAQLLQLLGAQRHCMFAQQGHQRHVRVPYGVSALSYFHLPNVTPCEKVLCGVRNKIK
jgi:hypothetical protein